MYSQKTIQGLKPGWYYGLSSSEKIKEQNRLKEERASMWADKPVPIKCGSLVVAKMTKKNVTQGKPYRVLGYFATLVTTIYGSVWHEFITFKNDNGWTVKMNLNGFDYTKQDG